MKRAGLFFLFLACTIFLGVIQFKPQQAFNLDKAEQVHSYFLKEPTGSSYVKAAPFYIVNGYQKDAHAYSFVCDASKKDFMLSKLNARFVRSEKLDNINIKYYFSDALKNKGIEVDGKRSNLQVAVTSNAIIIGYPIIVGSY